MNPVEKKYINYRSLSVAIIFMAMFAIIGAKALYLQVYKGPWLSSMAAGQYERSFTSSGKRGIIYDRKHDTEMAVSTKVTSIAAYPPRIKDLKSTARALSKVLKQDSQILIQKLTAKKSFTWIKRQVTPKETDEIKALNLAGIGFIPEYNRFYPNKTLAAQILGFTGIDGNGLEGIEYYYDSYLNGENRDFTILTDALGQRFTSERKRTQDYSGNNLILTIDLSIQYISEKTLKETVENYSAKSGIVIVMAPKTGEILAVAHYPLFNPNSFQGFKKELWRNRAITDPFEPGSTMKIFSAATAIESSGSTANSIFFCENGAYKIGKNVVHDHSSHGWLSLQQIIKYSSNIGTVKVSEMIGPERLYHTLRDFGFGAKTGIDCPGETAGSMAPYKKWSRLDTGAIAFGHGVSVSPIQLVTAVSALANRGVLMKPHLVKVITDPYGRTIHEFEIQKVRRVVSEETARIIVNIMRTVTTKGGTGTRAALNGYSVCGKTGTAQKINEEKTYEEGKYIASFVGFTPAENPEITVLVVINEPKKQYYGGIVAAPAFRKIARETLNYLNIPPEKSSRQLAVSKEKGGKG